ncbi:MAG: ImmA/IrrE family metallo-endopeptidase [Neglectibacter timonensis]
MIKMNRDIKKKTKSFIKDFKLQTITLKTLRAAIEKQGYVVIEYNNIFNSENVTNLIAVLGLEHICERSKGFTYADSKRRLVFLHEDLSEQEKLMVLAHEEGHIYCNHLSSVPIIGRDVVEEYEANEFAHYLLHQGIDQRVRRFVSHHKKATITIATIIVIAISITFLLCAINHEKNYYGDFYITSTGNKYHEAECIFVKHKDNVHRLTVEQFESGEYEPCDICLPHGSQ